MAAGFELAKRLLAAGDLGLAPEILESKALADLPGQVLTPGEGLGVQDLAHGSDAFGL